LLIRMTGERGGGQSRGYRKDRERRRNQDRKQKSDVKSETSDVKKEENTSKNEAVTEKVEEKVAEVQEVAKEAEVIALPDPALQKAEIERMEKETLDAYIKEAGVRHQWKTDLRKLNTDATANRSDDDRNMSKLDSSLKKNTAFIRKCKTFSEASKNQVMQEMKGLNLSKYVGELAQALVECKLKMSDVNAVLEFCSAVHQRYAEFSVMLLENWTKVLSMKKEDKVSNPSKLRVDLRLYSDLISIGVFTLKEGLPLLGNVLLTLVAQDKESLSNISIIISFCKHCGDDYAGLIPYSIRCMAEKHGYTLPRPSLLLPEKQKPVRNILKDYYNCLSTALLEIHKEVNAVERGNRRQLLTRGEINAERKERLERLTQEKEKLVANTTQMAEAVSEGMVELPVLQSEKDEEEEAELAAEVTEDNLGSIWDDEDTKAFYESLPDLIAIIPSILYKDSKEEAEAEKPKDEGKKSLDDDDDDDVQDDEEVEEVNLEDEDDMQEAISLSNKMALDAFLGQLSHCVNRDMIDSAAAEFCMNHNTKSNRKRLVKALFMVHRTRTDLLPFYARLTAALGPCMPDVPSQLAGLLKQDFRWQVRKKDQINIESKLKVCRFIGEMVKFRLFPAADVLFCVKQLLFDFSHHHIEMACTFFETCGTFLYRSPDSHRRSKIYLEQMVRKKAALSLDSRYVTMIENAYYLVTPANSTAEARKERPPEHQFLRKLIYGDLNKNNCEKILKQIRKYNWEDPNMAAYIVKCIKNVWNLKYFNIRYLASLVAGLMQYHDWVPALVTDDILEDIRMGMEVNNPKFNQRRTSLIRFLGELYNYRIVDSSLIFKVLYSLITFGVVLDHEQSEHSLDPPAHTLRLRLVCVLLDTCGQYFSTGSSKKKLDYFLLYFQRYFWFKRSHPHFLADERNFPLGIANLYLETITTLRPKLKRYSTFEEACLGVQKAENEFLALLKQKGYISQPTLHSSEEGGVGREEEDGLRTITEEQEEEEEEEDYSQHSADLSQHSTNRSRSASQAAVSAAMEDDWPEDDVETAGADAVVSQEEDDSEAMEVEQGDEELLLPSAPVKVECQEDDDFMSALDQMINENITESKNLARDKSSLLSVAAPISSGKGKKTYEQLQEEGGGGDDDTDDDGAGKVEVRVMLRKGGGKTAKGISVSANSQLGEQFTLRDQREAIEKARLKKLTLKISERQEEEELNEAVAHLQRVSLMPSRRNFKPQKGVPDTDAIFGKKTSKF